MSNERGFWIRWKGNEKFEDTKAEVTLDELAAFMGLKLVRPTPMRVWKDEELSKRGYRNLRIPGELLSTEEYRAYVGWCLRAFLSMNEPTNYRLSA